MTDKRFAHHLAVKDAARWRRFADSVDWWTALRYESRISLYGLFVLASAGNYEMHHGKQNAPELAPTNPYA